MSTIITTPTDTEILITRSFNAPREAVWDCHTKPELVRRWMLGPAGWSMPVCEIDLRIGGKYRYEWAHAEGRSMGMGGVFQDVQAPARLVSTEMFDDDWTGGETLNTIAFSENNGKTTSMMLVRYASKDARDGALKTGMTDGMEAGYQRVDALLEELKK
jgi:uncharacterized protein YndB with AHSA1/START domain